MNWLSSLPDSRTQALPHAAGLTAQGRIAIATVAVLAVVCLNGLVALTIAVGAALALATALRVPLPVLGARLRHVEGFVLIVLIVLPLTGPAPVLVSAGPLSLSEPGLQRALTLALKVNACVILLFALIATLDPIALARGLARLGTPARLIQILLVALRYLPVLHREAARLSEAMRARGFRAGPNRHTLRCAGHLVGTLLVRALDRAERVDEAMRCRGFTGRFPTGADAGWHRIDRLALAATLLAGLGLVLLDRSLA